MAFYHIGLYPGAKKLFAIVLPWGKCEHQKILMGVCNIPDSIQEKTPKLFEVVYMIRAHIDDVLAIP